MHSFMSVSIWGMKQYRLILVLNAKQSEARGELSEPAIVTLSMASGGFKWKSNTNGPNSNQRGQKNQELGAGSVSSSVMFQL